MIAILFGFTLGTAVGACNRAHYSSYGSSVYITPLPSNSHNSLAFMDIARYRAGLFTTHQSVCGRVVIELFDSISPVSTTNFRGLCQGKHGTSGTGHKLCYSGTRLLPNECFIRGGDVTFGSAAGGWSIYGRSFREMAKGSSSSSSRSSDVKGKGLVYAVGANAQWGSEFLITVDGFTPGEDHILLGQVVEGYDVLQRLQQQSLLPHAKRFIHYRILKAGVLKEAETPNYGKGSAFLRF
ncbi:cyclophilin-type peptidyl-prolyl cis-trans isomerase [Trypanosoma brucei equiperdum]|uniref:Cyclophilin-type peptidyl-prolyl cis-trans isomerase n=1 Tax=Trypanosoma brucei equiperdum TaxID=630700 RepID=A0A3L6L752_9TRYP|nr:cyclophilin-type peptidyl-prolyl cis-trans isomerase [Trypanosoma brucei equiperdum]